MRPGEISLISGMEIDAAHAFASFPRGSEGSTETNFFLIRKKLSKKFLLLFHRVIGLSVQTVTRRSGVECLESQGPPWPRVFTSFPAELACLALSGSATAFSAPYTHWAFTIVENMLAD